ncbi:MAG: hypothetical protein MI923_06205 [Phycisphaerales bacterium]|nr:hypothetical protein [Phycisphaerales bacterium]
MLVSAFVAPATAPASPVHSPPIPHSIAQLEAQPRKKSKPPPKSASGSSSSCASLLKSAKTATTPLERAHAHLAAARCKLVLECAPPLSLELYGRGDSQLARIVDQGLSHLNLATNALGHLPDDFDADARRSIEDKIDLLRAFATMFAAIAKGNGSTEAKTRLTNACIDLAIYVDDPNSGVVDSAKLWQAVAYRRAGRPDRALQLLLPALAPSSSSRIDFLARIERCRALADKGRFVAALSLTMKLDARIENWFDDEEKEIRKGAENAIRWISVDIYKRWATDLRAQGNKPRAQAAERRAMEIVGKGTYPPPPDRSLNLKETIAGLPDWNFNTPRDVSQ